MAQATIQWALSLPPCPIHISVIAAIRANLALIAKLQAQLGVDARIPQSVSQFNLTMRSLAINFSPMFPMLAITPPQLVMLLNLSSLLAQAATMQSAFNLNIFAPTFPMDLRLALQARLALPPIPAPPPMNLTLTAEAIANVNAWLALSELIQSQGSLWNLIPTLNFMANLALPPITLKLFDQIAAVTALQQTSMQLNTMLGLNPFAVNLQLALPPLFEPLKFLETLTLGDIPSATSTVWPTITTQTQMQVNATVAMDFRAMVKIPIPNLTPLNLAVKFIADNPVTDTSSCGSGCPMNVSR